MQAGPAFRRADAEAAAAWGPDTKMAYKIRYELGEFLRCACRFATFAVSTSASFTYQAPDQAVIGVQLHSCAS